MDYSNEFTYTQRFIAIIDLLGFSDYIFKSESENEKAKIIYSLLHDTNAYLIHGEVQRFYDECHNEREILSVSDSIIISYPIVGTFPLGNLHNILIDICDIQNFFLSHGWICRGGISLGSTYHNKNVVFGPAYIKAYNLERAAIFPRVILDESIFTIFDKKSLPFILCDVDKFYFVDYLRVLQNHTQGVEIMKILHEKITEILKQETNAPIIEKYWWLKEYYNYNIDMSRGSLEKCKRIGDAKTERFCI